MSAKLILFVCVVSTFVDSQLIHINVGMLFTGGLPIDDDVGYNVSAGAVVVALDLAKETGLLNPQEVNITFSWYFDQCDQSLAAGYAAKLIYEDKVSLILGPVCPESAKAVGALAAYVNIPVFVWGPTMPYDFSSNSSLYPTTLPMSGTVLGTLRALSYFLMYFNWPTLGFIYTTITSPTLNHIPVCADFANVMQYLDTYYYGVQQVYTRQVINDTVTGYEQALTAMKSRARIILTCQDEPYQRRNIMQAAINNNMLGNEYVYVFIQTNALNFDNPPFWVDDDGTVLQNIKTAAKKVLIVDKYLNDSSDQINAINDQFVEDIAQWPFYCDECAQNQNVAVLGINITLNNGVRSAKYAVYGLDNNGNINVWGTLNSYIINAQGQSVQLPFQPMFDDVNTSVFGTWNGVPPLAVPICGFNGEGCPPSPWLYIGISAGGVLLFIAICVGLILTVYIFRRNQRIRLNALWQIGFTELSPIEHKENAVSMNSMQSANSNSTKTSLMRRNTDFTEFMNYKQEVVVARKIHHLHNWTMEEEEEFRQMRTLDRQNLNRFIGIARSGAMVYILWAFCDRGSIMEVLESHAFRIDGYIMTGMIKDIVEGLHYLHHSAFTQHGTLSAYKCLVGERFEVRIQFYGLSGFKLRSRRRLNERGSLYVAPEHLDSQQNTVGSKAGDIYSFAITSSVILTRKPAFNVEDREETEEEIAKSVMQRTFPLMRPTLDLDPSVDIPPELIKMVERCWADEPIDRPDIDQIREFFLRKIFANRSANVMDHMFALMENNAAELEQDVQQRTLELMGEQKKADVLLYRMMPREAADMLKLGQTVAPEVFESATVFFSDIVSFTVIASKSTPLQIINFLNEVYTLADNVIDQHDVYKVETIGDGMHVVSGIPKRNGMEHVRAIARMAIAFQRAVRTLRLAHLPSHRVEMRVGIHSGACVAGIVGVTAPRYCVFGDTVNIAARMEASASRIHMTADTQNLLQQYFPNEYKSVERGETLIKGVGAKFTYWLVPKEDDDGFLS